MLSIINNIKIYILTLAALLTILGQMFLLLLPDFNKQAFMILTFAYLIWCVAFVAYVNTMPNTNPFHMRLAAVFVLMLFYACQVGWIIYNLHLENKEAIKSVETTSLGAALAASIIFVLSTVYPEYSKNFCYGLIGSLTLLSAAIISIFKSINQHLSVVIAMIMLIIQGWINSF